MNAIKSFGLWIFCFGKGKATIAGTIIATAPVVLRNLAEQLNLTGFPDTAAMITTIVGVAVVAAGLIRKAVGWLYPPDTPCL